MSEFETDNPEFYPIFLILDRTLLPPEMCGDLQTSIMSSGVNMEGDTVLITRDHIDDANGRDRRKRGTDNKPKSQAGKHDTKKKVVGLNTNTNARLTDHNDYEEVVTINDEMLDRMRDIIPRLLDEKTAEQTEKRRLLLANKNDPTSDDKKRRKPTTGNSKGSRPSSRSARTNLTSNISSENTSSSSLSALPSVTDDLHMGVLGAGQKNPYGLLTDDGTPMRVPIFFIFEGIIRKAGDAQRLASAGFQLSLILVPRLVSSESEPIYYIPELGLVEASQLVLKQEMLNTQQNSNSSTEMLLGSMESTGTNGYVASSSATPGVAMASMTAGAAAAAIYRLPSAETAGIENEYFPKLPGELAMLVSVDMRFTHLTCKLISVPECESVITIKAKKANTDISTMSQKQSRKERRTTSSGSASSTRPMAEQDEGSKALLPQSDALIIAGGEVRLALRSFGYDRYAYDAWLFGVNSTEMPVRSQENELAYSDQLYQQLLKNIPYEMIGIDTIVYALCQQAGNTSMKMTGQLMNDSVPPPPPGNYTAATQTHHNNKDNTVSMKGVVLGLNSNISLGSANTNTSNDVYDFAIPSGPCVVFSEVDTVQVLESCLEADNLLDFMNKKLYQLVRGSGPQLTPVEKHVVENKYENVEYEQHVADMIIAHADDAVALNIAGYCSRSGTTLKQQLADPDGVMETYGAVLRALEFNNTPVPGARGAGLPFFAGGGSVGKNQAYGELGVVERSIALTVLHNIREQQATGSSSKYSRTATTSPSVSLQELSNEQVLASLGSVDTSVVERALVSLAFEHMLCYPGLSFNITSSAPIHCGVVGNLPVTYYKGIIRNEENNAYSFQSALNYQSLLFAHLHAISTPTAQVCSIAPLSNSSVEGQDGSFNDIDSSYISNGNYAHLKAVQQKQQNKSAIPRISGNLVTDSILYNLQLTSECIPQVVQLLSDPSVHAKIEALLVQTLKKQGVFGSSVSDDSVEQNANHGTKSPLDGAVVEVDGTKPIGFGHLGDNNNVLPQFQASNTPVETLTDRDSWLHLSNKAYSRNIMVPYTPNAFLRTMQAMHCDPSTSFMHCETSYLPVLDALLVSVSSKPNILREKYKRWSTSFCPNLNFSEWSAAPAFVRKHKPIETFRFTIPHTGEIESRSKLLHPLIGTQSVIGKEYSASGRSKWRQVWAVQDGDWFCMEDHHQSTVSEQNNTEIVDVDHINTEAKGLAGYSNSAATRAVILAGKDSRVIKIVRGFSAKFDQYRLFATYEDDSLSRTPAARVCRSDVAAPLLDSNRYRAGIKGLKVSVRDNLGQVYDCANTLGQPIVMTPADAHMPVFLLREISQAQSVGTSILDIEYAIEVTPIAYNPAMSIFTNFKETSRSIYNSGTVVLTGHYPCQGHTSLRVSCDITLFSDSSILYPVLLKTSVLQEVSNLETTEDQEDTMEQRYVYIDAQGLCWLKTIPQSKNITAISEDLLPFIYPVHAVLTLNNHVETDTVNKTSMSQQAHVATAIAADSLQQNLTLTRADGTQLCVYPNNNTVVQFADGTRVFVDRSKTEEVQFTESLHKSLVYIGTVDVEHPQFQPVSIVVRSLDKEQIDQVFSPTSKERPSLVSTTKTVLLGDGSMLTRHANTGVTLRKRHGALYAFAPTYTSHYEADLLFDNPNAQGLYNPIPPADDDQGIDVYQTHPVFAVNNEKSDLGYAKTALRDPRLLLPRCIAVIPAHILHNTDAVYREYGIGGDISLLLRKLATTTAAQTSAYKHSLLKNSEWAHPSTPVPTGLKLFGTTEEDYSKLLTLLYVAKIPLRFQTTPNHAYFLDMRAGSLLARDARDDIYTADLTDPGAVKQVHPIVLTSHVSADTLDISNLQGHVGWNAPPEQSICQCDPTHVANNVPATGKAAKSALKSKEPKKLNLVGVCTLCNLPYQPLPRISKPILTHEELLLTVDDSAVESAHFGAKVSLHELRNTLITGKKDIISLAPLLSREPEMDTQSRLFVLFKHLNSNTNLPGSTSTITTHISKPLTTSTPLQLPNPFTHGFSHAIELCAPQQTHLQKLLRRTLGSENTTILPVEVLQQQEGMKLYRMLTCITSKSPYILRQPVSMTPISSQLNRQYIQATMINELWETKPLAKDQVLCAWKAYLTATKTETKKAQFNSEPVKPVPEFKSEEALQSELLWIVMQAKAAQREVVYVEGSNSTDKKASLLEQTLSEQRLLQPNNSRVPLVQDSNRLGFPAHHRDEETKTSDLQNYFQSSKGTVDLAIQDLFARCKDVAYVSAPVASLVLPLLDAKYTVQSRSVDQLSSAWKDLVTKCKGMDAVASLLETLGFQQDTDTVWVQSVQDDVLVRNVRKYEALAEQYIVYIHQQMQTVKPVSHGQFEENKRKFQDKKTSEIKSEVAQISKQYKTGVRTEFGETGVAVKTALSVERRSEEDRIRGRTHGKAVVHEKWGKSFVDRSLVQDTPREDKGVALKSATAVPSLTAKEMHKLSQLSLNSAHSTIPTYTVKRTEVAESTARQLSQTARANTGRVSSQDSLAVTKPAGE